MVGARFGNSWFVGVAALWVCSFIGCSSGGSNGPTTAPETIPDEPTPKTCAPGKACSCPAGQSGTTLCTDGEATCDCKACAGLELKNAPTVAACGGEPFGVWRLTKLELGSTPLSLSSFGEALGSCTSMLDTPAQVPHALMSLQDGGRVEYVTEETPTKAHWSNSCVTSKLPSLSCGSKDWIGVFNCTLSCDTCTCDTRLGIPDPDLRYQWQRTETTLSISQFGDSSTFEYCAKDGKLSLSGAGALLEYEQVFTVDTPAPCEGRSADQCALGTGCKPGSCDGSDACLRLASASQCLTTQGCHWNAEACRGVPEHCALADFGVVPGCDFADQPLSCTGTPNGCDTLDVDSCTAVGGCKVNTRGRCSGPTLQCEGSWCPSGYCSGSSLNCTGVTSCSAFKTDSQCGYANDDFPNAPCTWESSFCDGTPTPCSTFDQSTCGFIPGCHLGIP